VFVHFASKERLPSILRQECLECSDERFQKPSQELLRQVYTVVLDTKLDYAVAGVLFKDCTDVVHGFLTCPVLRTSYAGPIPLEVISDHGGTKNACATCLSLD
jgi:hypothetical protein